MGHDKESACDIKESGLFISNTQNTRNGIRTKGEGKVSFQITLTAVHIPY